MIEIKNLYKSFGKLQVLKDVSIQLPSSACISLIGPNGCGKTTLLKSILGMVIPDKGEVLVKNENIRNDWKYRSCIGYMPQIGRYPDNMKIGQVIAMMKDIRNENKVYDTELIDAFELKKLFEKPMQTLSGGTRQKVSACLAFLFNPEIMILDEPTSGLDPISAEILKEKILKEKNNGKLILVTSHILSDLDEIISDIIYMQDGSIEFFKSFETLKAETAENKLSKAIASVMKKAITHE
jgi:Cu-processing system ATP-binding protein